MQANIIYIASWLFIVQLISEGSFLVTQICFKGESAHSSKAAKASSCIAPAPSEDMTPNGALENFNNNPKPMNE